MSLNSGIDPVTLRAYLETEYQVYGAKPFTLKVGTVCPALAELHTIHAVKNSAFITACNPFSTLLDKTDNAARHTKLREMLIHRGFVIFEGIGKHPAGDWPGEPGFLILGIRLEAASALGNQLEQNAIIWNSDDAVSQLILLR